MIVRLLALVSMTMVGLPAAALQKQASPDCDAETPVLMVVSGETLDRERMIAYAKAIADSGIYGETLGYYLNAPRPLAVYEGDVPANHATLIVRFPSQCAAEAFWFSDLYQQQIKPLRLNPSAGDYSVTLYREAELPAYLEGKVTAPDYHGD